MSRTATTTLGWMRRLTVAVMAAGAMIAAAPAASAAPVVSSTGNYCAYNSTNGVTACVDAEKDYPAAKAAAGIGTAKAAQFLLGRFYDNASFNTGAGFLDWFGNAQCTASTTNVDSAWPDTTTYRSRISSFQGFSSCFVKAYENAGYGGASLGYVQSSSNAGILNDHIWSVRFS